MADAEHNKLIGVIDEGTNTASFILYKLPHLEELCSHSVDIRQEYPHEGWVEQDPLDIVNTVLLCAKTACGQLPALGFAVADIISIGVTNQRETTVVWDRYTGQPFCNAIAWNDIRTDETVDKILARVPDQNPDHFKAISGLTISSYFSALKLRWLLDNVPAVRRAVRERRCLAGTIDTWLIWNLTGGPSGGVHATDVTNASRTLLMNIETLHWDPVLQRTFGVRPELLPEIRSSSEIFGTIRNGSVLDGIPISGVLANQQASLVGQKCLKAGQAKNTYRSGCFLLCNTGEDKVLSTHGLLTTVAYKLGPKAAPVYALEGSVAIAGAALKWLQNNLKVMKSPEESEHLAGSVFSTGDVYFVPAFTGLYAPYWRKDARGIICGITGFTTKHHIVRAALEAICFQTRDVLESMRKDGGFTTMNRLYVDGVMTANSLLMQLQADLSGVPVLRSDYTNTAARGVAWAAGLAEGIGAFTEHQMKMQSPHCDTFLPTTTETDRDQRYHKWKMAIERSLGWSVTKKSESMTDERFRLLASVPASLFVMGTFVMLAVSRMHKQ